MDIKIEDNDKTIVCPACLCIGRTLHDITDDRLKSYYLNVLDEIQLPVPLRCPRLCWECAAVLRGSVAFRRQVQDCCRILQTYTNEKLTECLLTEVSRPPRLRARRLGGVSIAGEVDALPETRAVFVKEEAPRLPDCEVKRELPPSDASDDRSLASDASDDLARLEAEVRALAGPAGGAGGAATPPPPRGKARKRKGEREADKVKKTKKGKGPEQEKKPQPQILTVELSFEEVQAERARKGAREAFTRARWRCLHCLLAFRREDALRQHRAHRHRPELGRYACPVCRSVMSSADSFAAHYRRHTRRYVCGECGRRGSDRKALARHVERSHAARQGECSHAARQGEEEHAARQGERSHYTCRDCGAQAKSADALRYHRDSHKARVQCPDCDKTFSHRAGLLNHRLAAHGPRRGFPCAPCGKEFRWKTSLKKHMDSHHRKGAAPPAASCAPCGVSFASVCSYRRHLRHSLRHVTPDHHKFICDHCARRFANKTKLRDHIEEKHLLRTFRCHLCLKPSKNRVCLDQHLRNVHKGRPHDKMCHHCGKGFPTKVQLESHIRSHTGERPFICEVCPTTFSQQSNLYKHYRQVHLNIKSKRYALAGKPGKSGSRTGVPPPAPPANPATVVLSFDQDKQFVVQYDGGSNVTIV